MVRSKTPEVIGFLKDQLSDLNGLLKADSISQRALDSMLDIFLKQFLKLMEQFIGKEEPDTPSGRRRRRILLAATDLFIERGYLHTTVDDIAAAAGVAKGTVYQHFENKADLLVHAGALEKQRYMRAMRDVLLANLSPNDTLRKSLVVYFSMVHNLPLNSRILSGDKEMGGVLEDMGFPDPQSATDLQAAGLRYQMRRAAPRRWTNEQLETRSRILIGLIQATASMEDGRIRGGLSVEEFAVGLADMLMDGIGNPEDRSCSS